MKDFYNLLNQKIQAELLTVDLERCEISIEESIKMIRYLENCLSELRDYFLAIESLSIQDEIVFFKEIKPEILGLLLYFNNIRNDMC